ncbi:MAG: ABC transporter ATP-binding protein [Trueperaceae bacterium]|nr:ABC transporter ATP-binding protein [Trueperaceae bacterium]
MTSVQARATGALEVRGLEAGYGKIQVLWGIDLDVAEGEFVAIIGANGAGKTTLLRTLSGLIAPRGGSVSAFGRPLRGLSAARVVRSGVGHVPEGRQLFPLMSVRENLDAGADYLPAARARAGRNRAFVYELFPRLLERERQLAGTLSGGERQMVAIGRALMSDPRLLLVDEPSLGLAPALSASVFAALEQINADGVSVVLVEQNVHQSLKLADHAVVLETGEVVLRGTGSELLSHPRVREAYLSL